MKKRDLKAGDRIRVSFDATVTSVAFDGVYVTADDGEPLMLTEGDRVKRIDR